ncbi:MAG: hypothetical protein ACO26C_04500 [Ilumatobacteraceae bacterium]|jgi:DNA-binding CsgD family transcriptional regulator
MPRTIAPAPPAIRPVPSSPAEAIPRLTWPDCSGRRRTTSAGRLIEEWGTLATSPAALRRVAAWGLPGGPVVHLDQLLVRAGFGTHARDSDGDRVLWALVRRAGHDELAARIVLQRILPPLLAIARRRGRIVQGGVEAALDDVLAAAWGVIRRYPWHRRRAKVAANLVRDAEYVAFVRDARGRAPMLRLSQALADGLVAPDPVDDPGVVLARLIGEGRRAGLGGEDLEVLRALARGEDIGAIAARLGVSRRTARTRRARAISELRARTRCAG